MAGKIGELAFIVGVLIAVVVGLFQKNLAGTNYQGWLILLLVVLGLIVGFLNISEKETTPFLVAAVALLLTGTSGTTLGLIPKIGIYLAGIVEGIAVFVAPGAVVVALKAIKALAHD